MSATQRVAIMVDEQNAMSALHHIGIEGIRPWKTFFQSIQKVIIGEYANSEVSYHMYGGATRS